MKKFDFNIRINLEKVSWGATIIGTIIALIAFLITLIGDDSPSKITGDSGKVHKYDDEAIFLTLKENISLYEQYGMQGLSKKSAKCYEAINNKSNLEEIKKCFTIDILGASMDMALNFQMTGKKEISIYYFLPMEVEKRVSKSCKTINCNENALFELIDTTWEPKINSYFVEIVKRSPLYSNMNESPSDNNKEYSTTTGIDTDSYKNTCDVLAKIGKTYNKISDEARNRGYPSRSSSRDQLDDELRKLSRYSMNSKDFTLGLYAYAIEDSLNRAFMQPATISEELVTEKMCNIYVFSMTYAATALMCKEKGFDSSSWEHINKQLVEKSVSHFKSDEFQNRCKKYISNN